MNNNQTNQFNETNETNEINKIDEKNEVLLEAEKRIEQNSFSFREKKRHFLPKIEESFYHKLREIFFNTSIRKILALLKYGKNYTLLRFFMKGQEDKLPITFLERLSVAMGGWRVVVAVVKEDDQELQEHLQRSYKQFTDELQTFIKESEMYAKSNVRSTIVNSGATTSVLAAALADLDGNNKSSIQHHEITVIDKRYIENIDMNSKKEKLDKLTEGVVQWNNKKDDKVETTKCIEISQVDQVDFSELPTDLKIDIDELF